MGLAIAVPGGGCTPTVGTVVPEGNVYGWG